VKEQSHKSEMRAALRGDFERLRARRAGGPEGTAAMPRAAQEPDTAEPPSLTPAPAREPAELAGMSWLARIRQRS